MMVSTRLSADTTVIPVAQSRHIGRRIHRGLRQVWIERAFRKYGKTRPSGYEVFTDDRSADGPALRENLPRCDVINLHWVQGIVDYTDFFSTARAGVPLVWTLHDMNPFTGGCHYNMGCGNYLRSCGACPQLGSSNQNDLSAEIWHRKQRILSRVNPSGLRIVSPSRWLADEAKRSPILSRFSVSVIPYGLNLEEFAPRNRGAIRELLGIPANAQVVLFVAERTDNRRKGFAALLEALRRAAQKIPRLLLLTLGQGQTTMEVDVPSIHVGSIDNDRFLSMVYSAADVFVICSLQDNLPNTVLESLACGVPVVGVRVGGIPDMIREGTTGLTVDANDPVAISEGIAALLNNPERIAKMKAACRATAVSEYSLECQARRYVDLYQSFT